MEAMQRNKRRRVYSLEPDAVVLASFPHNYVSNLLPALVRATSFTPTSEKEDEEIEQLVRFEVDMALVLSAGGFSWSQALKHKLEHGANAKKFYGSPASQSTTQSYDKSYFRIFAERDEFQPLQSISRPLIPVECKMNATVELSFHSNMKTRPRSISRRRRTRTRMIKGEEEFDCRLRTLRRILPGGSEMGVHELLSEVQTYVVCLELQVSILKSLVATHALRSPVLHEPRSHQD